MIKTETAKLWDEAAELIEAHISAVDDVSSKFIVVLDDDPQWLDIIKKKTKHNNNIITISDTETFRAFIHENGISKMYIDINMQPKNGIDLAEQMRLGDKFGELIFVSNEEPQQEDFERIDALGSKFMSKGELLKKIIYPVEGA